MTSDIRVAVTSKTFSETEALRTALQKKYPNTKFNDEGTKLDGDSLIEFLAGCERVILGTEALDQIDLGRLPELKVVAKYGVGINNVDFGALEKHGIRFAWKGGINKRSVSELTLCMAISLLRHVNWTNRQLQNGKWNKMTGNLLSDKVVGIIGCGHIGKDLVGLLRPLGCKILVHDIRDYADFYTANDVKAVDKETLLKEADVVTVHTPLDGSTKDLIGDGEFEIMKRSAILLNTARGGIVNEQSLLNALQSERIAGAACDAFVDEPLENRALIEHPKFIATPHIGGSAMESVLLMGYAAIEGLDQAQSIKDFRANNPEVSFDS